MITRTKEIDDRLLKLIFESLPEKKSIKKKIYQTMKTEINKDAEQLMRRAEELRKSIDSLGND